jgi:hypothetical protein
VSKKIGHAQLNVNANNIQEENPNDFTSSVESLENLPKPFKITQNSRQWIGKSTMNIRGLAQRNRSYALKTNLQWAFVRTPRAMSYFLKNNIANGELLKN